MAPKLKMVFTFLKGKRGICNRDLMYPQSLKYVYVVYVDPLQKDCDDSPWFKLRIDLLFR